MISIDPEVENCYKIFALSSKCDPEARSIGEQILTTILKRAVGQDHGQAHSQSKAAYISHKV